MPNPGGLQVKDMSHAVKGAANQKRVFFEEQLPPHPFTPSAHEDVHRFDSSQTQPLQRFIDSLSKAIPVVVELCAGAGGLSAALKVYNLQVVAIDHTENRHRSKVAIVNIDLASSSGQQLVRELLSSGLVTHVHGAPPCGTASRARDKPVPEYLRKLGAPNPQPLRSDKFPEGLPNLIGVNATRVKRLTAYIASWRLFQISSLTSLSASRIPRDHIFGK
jgi:hypothetical protein